MHLIGQFPLPFLFVAGFIATGMNALAGGGSFVSLPALIAVGLPSVVANASNTVALWPGGIAGAWTYHEGFRPVCGVPLVRLLVATAIGGVAGSVLLLLTPSSAFDQILPWLLLVAALAMAFAPRLRTMVSGHLPNAAVSLPLIQFVLGVYGGYFGGAVGLIMLTVWLLFGETRVKALNAPRTLLVVVTKSVAVAAFVIAGIVRWPETLAMLAGGLAGGAAGARLGRIVPARYARPFTLVWMVGMTGVFFWRAHLR